MQKRVREIREIDEKPLNLIDSHIKKKNNKAQVTLFIIIAVLIVVSVSVYFVFRSQMNKENVPKDFLPIYNYYISCVQDSAHNGAIILGQQGGYINTPQYSPGSVYMPFSSQLNFFGTGVPYWYYISGNGVIKEQKPGLQKMESELNDYIHNNLFCDFSSFEEQGFYVTVGDLNVNSKIEQNLISLDVNQELKIEKDKKVWKSSKHNIDVKSSLGKFYDIADKIYSMQKDKMFLENYGVDILRLYAPVDGSDISCGPKIWSVNEVRENLTEALEANIPQIKVKGDYYTLSNPDKKYYVQDLGKNIDFNVNFMFSREWPMKVEIWPSQTGILRADPIGLQEGMGMLGFCYVPYHFVYDFAFPVLVQLYSQDEIFQFPVVVSIVKNHPREPLNSESMPNTVPELCDHKITKMDVYSYNTNLEPVSANLRFKCFDTSCDIGSTIIKDNEASYSGEFPQCGNGYIIASAEGYEDAREVVSTLSEGIVNIVLKKKYKLGLELDKAGSLTNESAIITFSKNGSTLTVPYPDQNNVELSEGQYIVKAYVYSGANIPLQGSSTEKCIDVPKSGVLGMFGFSESKCFTLNIPSQNIDRAVSGGGIINYYVSESELMDSKKIILDAESFPYPKEIQDIQNNYNNVDVSRLNMRFEK